MQIENVRIALFISHFDISAGAYCTRCPINLELAHNPEVVKNGFEEFWTKEKLLEWYEQLRKNPDGSIWKSKKGISFIEYLVIVIMSNGYGYKVLDVISV